MRKSLVIVLLCAVAQWTWAETVDINVSTESELREAVTINEARIWFQNDITISRTLFIEGNRSVVIRLEHHTLDRGLTSRADNGQIFHVDEGSTLSVNIGTLTGAYGADGGAIYNHGTLIVEKVDIVNNNALDRGGAISNYGTLTMKDCTISGNTSHDNVSRKGGGGIYNEEIATLTRVKFIGNHAEVYGGGFYNSGTLTLTDCTFSGNSAGDQGGGFANSGYGPVHVTAEVNNCTFTENTAGDGAGIYNESTLTLNNDSIAFNQTTQYGGGGMSNKGDLTMNNVTITSNQSHTNAGGLYSNTTFSIQGKVKITGNKDKHNLPSNVQLAQTGIITVAGNITGSKIGVNMDTPALFTSGCQTYCSEMDPRDIFSSDWNPYLVLTLNENNEVVLGKHNENDVYYIHRYWDQGAKQVQSEIKVVSDYTELTGGGNYTMEGTYYVVKGRVNYNHLSIDLPDVKYLILCDGAKLTADYLSLPRVSFGFYIAGQYEDSGILSVENAPDGHAAIGGAPSENLLSENTTDLFIYGGTIYAAGSDEAAGIGSGSGEVASFEKIQIYGGNVHAQGGDNGAGIGFGGGLWGSRDDCEISIFGGYVDAHGGEDAAGIGGGDGGINANHFSDGCNIYIHGGEVHAYGSDGAGIGGADSGKGGNIVINGGKVYAYGGSGTDNGAGIGGGVDSNGGKITINGGYVEAHGGNSAAGIGGGENGHGGDITINGGTVLSYGYNGAAIGGGNGGDGGKITINGGDITARGDGGDDYEGAAIGGGINGDGGTIVINGGNINAYAGEFAAAIGGGTYGSGGDITINGGTIFAKTWAETYDQSLYHAIGPANDMEYDYNYGKLTIGDEVMVSCERLFLAVERRDACWHRGWVWIKPCDHSEVTYTVDGTTDLDHHIAHCIYCNHTDTALHTFDEHGVCTVCGVQHTAYAATLYLPVAQPDGSFDGQTYHRTHIHRVVPETDFVMPMEAVNVPGYQFVGWEAVAVLPEEAYTSDYTTATADTLYRVGNRYKMTGDISFVARYRQAVLVLHDNQSNSGSLNYYEGVTMASVTLSGRTFHKNGQWTPICLPFALSAEQLAASPLAGCALKQLDTEGYYDANLVRYTEPGEGRYRTGIDRETGKLHLYYQDTTAIEAGHPYLISWASGDDIISPEFTNVIITNSTKDTKGLLVTLMGTFNPRTFEGATKTFLYFAEDGSLVAPDGVTPATVGAFRAYYRLTNLIGESESLIIVSNIDGVQGIESVTGYGLPVTGKIIRNGMLFIERNGKIYNAQGAEVR